MQQTPPPSQGAAGTGNQRLSAAYGSRARRRSNGIALQAREERAGRAKKGAYVPSSYMSLKGVELASLFIHFPFSFPFPPSVLFLPHARFRTPHGTQTQDLPVIATGGIPVSPCEIRRQFGSAAPAELSSLSLFAPSILFVNLSQTRPSRCTYGFPPSAPDRASQQ